MTDATAKDGGVCKKHEEEELLRQWFQTQFSGSHQLAICGGDESMIDMIYLEDTLTPTQLQIQQLGIDILCAYMSLSFK